MFACFTVPCIDIQINSFCARPDRNPAETCQVFRHESAEDSARVGKNIIAARSGTRQRFDPSPNGLRPDQGGEGVERGFDGLGLAQNDVHIFRGLSRKFQINKPRFFDQSAVFIFIL